MFSKSIEGIIFINKLKASFKLNAKDNLDHQIGYLNIGNLYKLQGKLDKAEAYYKKSIDYFNHNYKAYIALGQINEIKCNFEEALNCYKKSLEIKPASSEACNSMGRLLENFNFFHKKAMNNYETSIKMNISYAEAYNSLGRIYYKQGDLKAAKFNLNKAIENDKTCALYHSNIGILNETDNKLDEALNHYIKAINLDKNEKTFFIG